MKFSEACCRFPMDSPLNFLCSQGSAPLQRVEVEPGHVSVAGGQHVAVSFHLTLGKSKGPTLN